ncbi:MAG: hypothetical protein NC402_08115 [Prevotella sp.]|nr:hypothetical protein [Prevotella sp.]MCM1075144.1 hypothetical protein [Ruminococcus sp.]
MKKIYTLLTALCVCMCVSLTSCDDDVYGPPGAGYDPDLIGTWELYQADGVRVAGYQVNWLEFNSGGRGTYYYYNNGLQYSMWLRYSVDWYGNSSQLYIDYQDGSSVSMDYWFNSNATYLYTQWYERGYRHQYVYRYVDGPAWAPKKAGFKEAPAENVQLPLFTPGINAQSVVAE